MSKYTTEVRNICDFYAGMSDRSDYSDIDTTIEQAEGSIFENYPIFDENYRSVLNCKILKHYYTREICEETLGLWKLRLNVRMNEIMPYYNKLYTSELLSFNPFYDVDLTTKHNMSNQSDSSGTSVTEGENEGSRKNNGSSIENSNVETSGSISKDRKNNSSKIEEINVESEIERENKGNLSSVANEGVEGSGTKSENSSGKSNESNITTRDNIDKYSDTPQGGLSGIESDTYLTNARIVNEEDNGTKSSIVENSNEGENSYNENRESNTSSSNIENGKESNTETRSRNETGSLIDSENGTNSGNEVRESNKSESNIEQNSGSNRSETNDEKHIGSTESYLESVQGKRGGLSYSKLLQEYRETFLNIDKMIINELSDLFFGLWE